MSASSIWRFNFKNGPGEEAVHGREVGGKGVTYNDPMKNSKSNGW